MPLPYQSRCFPVYVLSLLQSSRRNKHFCGLQDFPLNIIKMYSPSVDHDQTSVHAVLSIHGVTQFSGFFQLAVLSHSDPYGGHVSQNGLSMR